MLCLLRLFVLVFVLAFGIVELGSKLIFLSAWAHKRGFMTAKAGRPDVYRAGKQRSVYFERWEVPQFPGVQTVGRARKKE